MPKIRNKVIEPRISLLLLLVFKMICFHYGMGKKKKMPFYKLLTLFFGLDTKQMNKIKIIIGIITNATRV